MKIRVYVSLIALMVGSVGYSQIFVQLSTEQSCRSFVMALDGLSYTYGTTHLRKQGEIGVHAYPDICALRSYQPDPPGMVRSMGYAVGAFIPHGESYCVFNDGRSDITLERKFGWEFISEREGCYKLVDTYHGQLKEHYLPKKTYPTGGLLRKTKELERKSRDLLKKLGIEDPVDW